jgi:hypothetical protein
MQPESQRVSAAWQLGRLACAVWLGLAGWGCSKKPSAPSGPPPELTGLAAVPATAEAVLGVDIGKLTDSPVIDRAVEQLLMRDPVLSERWQRLQSDCKLDLSGKPGNQGKQIKRVMLAIGPHTGPAPGTGPVIMVVVGSIPEAELKDCVAKLVGGGGGSVTGKPAFGRTLYLAKDGNRTMYFAYGKPDTIVLGADEAYVTEALGTGKKASDNPELGKWLQLVNQNSAIWAVGRTDVRVRDGLVRLTEGKISGGPAAFTLTADLASGASLDLGAVMSKAEDAKSLESYVKGELALLTAAAQWKSLGPVVGKIKVAVDGDVVHFRAPLTVDDLNLLLSALDGGSTPAQDSAPPTSGSGSGTTGTK